MTNKAQPAPTEKSNFQLESGTYEIIRNRLEKEIGDLKGRLQQLNTARKKVFGAVQSQLIANDRINTSNYCTARDMVALGQQFIFGYNVHIGLRSGIKLEDVFSVFSYGNKSFREEDLGLLRNDKFDTDFQNLYRYYKEAFFSRFVRQGAYLYMIFQVSKNVQDIKAFKWLIKGEKLDYVDARSEHEVRMPDQYEFRWKHASRDDQRMGRHPHISVLDRVFVETVGGDLTIKIEDNTNDGLGVYREAVEYPDQTLDDAEYFYADLGHLIALKIRPYQEAFRYFVYNEKVEQVQRIDALEDSGVLLPDGQGLIFANGYYLQTGEFKIFDAGLRKMRFDQRIISPNGEDYLYAFRNVEEGTYRLLPYNIIEQKVGTPIACHGYAIFADGAMCYFRAEAEPTRHHQVQVWQTPFLKGEILPTEHQDSYLFKVGNKEIVKAMAECYEILTLAEKEDSYSGLYNDLVKISTDVLDSYYWIDKEEAFALHQPLHKIRETANAAIEEYEKKVSIQRNTRQAIDQVSTKAGRLFSKAKRASFDNIDLFVEMLGGLRHLRGEIIALRDLRYTDENQVADLETRVGEVMATLSEACVAFLLGEEALVPYQKKIDQHKLELEKVSGAAAAKVLEEGINQTGGELQMLIDIVGNLKIDDATQTTHIIDHISGYYAQLNQLRVAIKRRAKELMGGEAEAEFGAQIRLLDQSIINFLDLADNAAKCDDFLTRLMVQLEELESKFAEYEVFTLPLAEKREEIYTAFDNRKKQLLEARNNRTSALESAANRILEGIGRRMKSFKDAEEINSFFAGDLMVDKVRDLIRQLQELEDNNKADTLQAQLKTAKETALREWRDRRDLFTDGTQVIRLGKHQFSVNVQPLELTIVSRENQLFFHLTGTNFYEAIPEEALDAAPHIRTQRLVSENESVYRSEYLAYQVWREKTIDGETADWETVLEAVQKKAAQGYEEGYVRGVHDEDAAKILLAYLQLERSIDLLRFPVEVRAQTQLIWEKGLDPATKATLEQQFSAARALLEVFPEATVLEDVKDQVSSLVAQGQGGEKN